MARVEVTCPHCVANDEEEPGTVLFNPAVAKRATCNFCGTIFNVKSDGSIEVARKDRKPDQKGVNFKLPGEQAP